MVSKARLDLPLPLGPVMTVNSPSGRSKSIPLRLFWRAPRISTQPLSGGAVTQGFSAVVEPTEDYPITARRSQIFGEERGSASIWVGGPLRRDRRRTKAAPGLSLEAFRHLFALGFQALGHVRLKSVEKFRLAFEFRFPLFRLDREEFAELRIVDVIDPDQAKVFPLRNESNRRFVCPRAAFASIDDPLQHVHVFAKAGPEKLSVGAFPEPVYVEDQGRIFQARAHLEPVAKIIAHAVSAEREHRHRIASNLSDCARRRRRRLRGHGRTDIDAVDPIERLE